MGRNEEDEDRERKWKEIQNTAKDYEIDLRKKNLQIQLLNHAWI